MSKIERKNKVLGVEISNTNRIVYPKLKITKLDIANYYKSISKYILPFLGNRPISVIRCHDSINKNIFFKKHAMPSEDVKRIKIGKAQEYFYINNKTQLIKQTQMGTIEFHTWASNINNINSPDIMVFDLDPDIKMPLNKLQQAVLTLKKVLDDLGLKSFLKTSGGKGYHILIPFKNIKNYKKFNEFALKIAIYLENNYDIFTTNIRKENRKNKIFIDYLRNKKGATCVCPFSLRARENAPISMPIPWDKITNIKPNQITIKNYKQYLTNCWQNFFKVEQTIN